MRVRMETAAGFQAFSSIFASPNSWVIQEASLDSVTSSKDNICAAAWATSSQRDAGSPEIVNTAIRYNPTNGLRRRYWGHKDCDRDREPTRGSFARAIGSHA